MRLVFIKCYINIIKNISRTSHDAIIKNFAENIASVSSGFREVSSQMEDFLTNKPTPPAPSTIPSALPNTSDTPNTSDLSSSAYTGLPLPPLAREDYPNVKYWDSDDYTSLRKVGRNNEVVKKSSILSSYMEDKNGDPIPEGTRNAAREVAKGFFILLLQKGRAPTTWGDASIDIKNQLTYMLETGFDFLRLCSHHWKAKQIATNSYSQWYGGRKNAVGKKLANAQVIDVDADSADTNQDNASQGNANLDKPRKRPHTEDDGTRRPKRPRVEEIESTPPRACPPKVTKQRQRVCKSIYYDYMRH